MDGAAPSATISALSLPAPPTILVYFSFFFAGGGG